MRKEGSTTRWSWHLGPDFLPLATPFEAQRIAAEALEAAETRLVNYDPIPDWAPRAGRRNLREKLFAGLGGFKHAIRGDSSFFAHGYRALLVFLIAGLLGVPPLSWCLLVFGFCLVLIAELAHSAIDTLARAVGDPEEPRLKTTRDIAAAMVLTAVIGSTTVSVTVVTIRLILIFEN